MLGLMQSSRSVHGSGWVRFGVKTKPNRCEELGLGRIGFSQNLFHSPTRPNPISNRLSRVGYLGPIMKNKEANKQNLLTHRLGATRTGRSTREDNKQRDPWHKE